MQPTRIETDSLGEVTVPADRYYGAQTQRSLENFPIGGERFPRAVIRACAVVKCACARVNREQGQLDERLAESQHVSRVALAKTDKLVDGRNCLSENES